MKLNEHTGKPISFHDQSKPFTKYFLALIGPKVLLVPYSRHHVTQYHTWMQNPHLQKLTASEPLSLKEEYEMQQSWREDGDKLTFIACVSKSVGSEDGKDAVVGGIDDADEKMIGDVNLFLSEDDEDDKSDGEAETKKVIGEVEIMIAEQVARGKGFGKAILLIFLWYILTNIDLILGEFTKGKAELNFLRVKIDAENERSIKLFEKVGFTKTSSTPNYFGEVELRLDISEASSLFKDMQEPSIALYRLPTKEAQSLPS
jgi:RimJ/RimL family protein N-acetyltransferase